MRDAWPSLHKNRGVALISVLLVFALVTVIAGEILRRNYFDLRKTSNFIGSKQAYLYALSGEQLARQLLYRDFDEQRRGGQPEVDSYADIWARDLPALETEGGAIAIRIHDLQGQFNLNDLIGPRATVKRREFAALASTLQLSADHEESILDWLDSDEQARPQGAEDLDYPDAQLPANGLFVDKTELRLLPRMVVEDYLQLEPQVCALPTEINGKAVPQVEYNINTVNAKLMEAMAGFTESETARFTELQEEGGFETLNGWKGSSVGAKINTLIGAGTDFGVKSHFFEIEVDATFQARSIRLRTEVYRDDAGKISVLKRQLEPLARTSLAQAK